MCKIPGFEDLAEPISRIPRFKDKKKLRTFSRAKTKT